MHKPTCETVMLAENATNRWWPVCDCGVDPQDNLVYGSSRINSETRSKTVETEFDEVCGYCGDYDHYEDECPDMIENDADVEGNIQAFLGRLEMFLMEEIDEDCRGTVFLSETGSGKTAINILVGVPFEGGPDKTCSQINVIIAPTDRKYLESEGTTINDMEWPDYPEAKDEEPEDKPRHRWFDAAMSIFRND